MNTPDFNSFFLGDSSQFPTIEIDDLQDMFLDGDITDKENISPSPAVRSVIVIPPSSTSTSTSTLTLTSTLTSTSASNGPVPLLSSHSTSPSAVFKCSACPVTFKKKKTLTRHFKEIHSKKCLFMECPVKSCMYETKRLPDIHRHLRSSHPDEPSLKPTQIVKRWKVNPSYSSPSKGSTSASVIPTVVTSSSALPSAPGPSTVLTTFSAPGLSAAPTTLSAPSTAPILPAGSSSFPAPPSATSSSAATSSAASTCTSSSTQTHTGSLCGDDMESPYPLLSSTSFSDVMFSCQEQLNRFIPTSEDELSLFISNLENLQKRLHTTHQLAKKKQFQLSTPLLSKELSEITRKFQTERTNRQRADREIIKLRRQLNLLKN